MQDTPLRKVHPVRRGFVQGLSIVEEVTYIGLGILLAIAAFALLYGAFRSIASAVHHGQLSGQIVGVLDQVLLTLLIIELLYTVQVSFREHGLLAEPFLVVALIAAIRRILVLNREIRRIARHRQCRVPACRYRAKRPYGNDRGAGWIAYRPATTQQTPRRRKLARGSE